MKYILITLFFVLVSIFNLKAQSNSNWTTNGMTAILSVDSSVSYDLTSTLKITFPQNHNVSKYRVSYTLFDGICSSTTLNSYTLSTFTLASRTAPTVVTFNVTSPSVNKKMRFVLQVINSQNQSAGLPISSCSPFDIFFTSRVRFKPTLSFDSLFNYDRTYKMTISIPKNSNIGFYKISDVNNINTPSIISSTLANDCTFTKTYIFRFQRNGYRQWMVTAFGKGVPTNCGNAFAYYSNPIPVLVNYTAPPPQVPLRCSPTVVKIIDKNYSNFTYNFPLSNNCANQKYISKFYRCLSANGLSPYDSTLTSNQVQSLGLTGPAFKNFDTNNEGLSQILTLTTQERTQGFFQRKVTPILTVSDCWYKIEVTCASCSGGNINPPAVRYVYVKKK